MQILKKIPWHIPLVLWVVVAITLMPFSIEAKAGWIVSLTIILWITEKLPLWFSALLFFVLTAIANIVKPQVFLSGMLSPATWLLIAGAIVGLAIQHTGLGKRLASYIVPFMTSYRRALLGSGFIGFILIFLMPSSMGRIIMLLPIILPLTEQLGYKDNPHATTGIVLSAVLVTFLPAFAVLPANIPNQILLGLVETLSVETPTYTGYLLLHFPILGVLKAVLIMALLCKFYQAPNPTPVKQELAKISAKEYYVMAILALTLILWLTEAYHGIGTAWVGMIGAVLCLYPSWNLTPKQPLQVIKAETLFYVAGIVSLGALVYHSGLATIIANTSLQLLPLQLDNNVNNFAVLSALSTLLSMLVTLPGTPAILTPMTQEFAHLSGWSPYAVYMSQVIGFSTVFFPYQAPPLVIAMQLGKIPMRDMLRMLLSVMLLSIMILIPLSYLWWRVLGVI
ncbi:MAG: anion permease [Moraxellaceae bacterium]|nr:anion permease [Moraxellaceae bacterium]